MPGSDSTAPFQLKGRALGARPNLKLGPPTVALSLLVDEVHHGLTVQGHAHELDPKLVINIVIEPSGLGQRGALDRGYVSGFVQIHTVQDDRDGLEVHV